MITKKKIIGKPLFENIFGENNTIKVLDFLLMGKDFDFTLSQIASGTQLSRTAVRNAVEELINNGLIVVSRRDVKSAYYKINRETEKFSLLNKLYRVIQREIIVEN
jgi:DNA-binding transcriptional ArsR family regulator